MKRQLRLACFVSLMFLVLLWPGLGADAWKSNPDPTATARAPSGNVLPVTGPLPQSTAVAQPIEHTVDSETAFLGDERYRIRVATEPQYYQDAYGLWQRIDPTLRLQVGTTGAEYVSDHGLVRVHLPTHSNAGAIRVNATAYVPRSPTLAPALPGETGTMEPVNFPVCGSSNQPVAVNSLNVCQPPDLAPKPPPSLPIVRSSSLTVSGEFIWTPLALTFTDAAGRQETVDRAADVEGVAGGSVLTYTGIFRGITERYTVRPDGLKHEVILSSPDTLPVTALAGDVFLDYQGTVVLSPNLTFYADGEKKEGDFITTAWIELRDPDNHPVQYLPPVVAYEHANPLNHVRGRYSVRHTPDGTVLSFGVPHNWLADPKRQYPVIVDPTVRIFPSSADTFVWQPYPQANYGWYSGLFVADSANSLLQWNLSSVPPMAMVDYSEFWIRLKEATGVPTATIGTYPVLDAWDENAATWITRTGTSTWNTPGGDYGGLLSSHTIYNVTDALYSWAVTDLAAEWQSGHTANNGILLKGQSSPPGDFNKIFSSKEDSSSWWVPELDIYYTQGPYTLTQYVPITRGVPSPDWYAFQSGSFWNVLAIRPPSGTDYDVTLYDSAAYTHALASSFYGSGAVDYVVVDTNHAPAQGYYPRITQFSGRGDYQVEQGAWTTDLITGTFGPYTMTASEVARVWDASLVSGTTYYIGVVPITGDADLAVGLHRSQASTPSTWYQGRASGVAFVDTPEQGIPEFFRYTAPGTDFYGFVVLNKGATLAACRRDSLSPNSICGKIATN